MLRSATVPVAWIRRSARVDLPWSIWATMEKLRMFLSGVVMARALPAGQIVNKRGLGGDQAGEQGGTAGPAHCDGPRLGVLGCSTSATHV